jgi:Fe-S-cluster containining protein
VYVNGVYRLSLKEKDNYDCIFWRDGGCTVYDARPLQCSTYPFWEDNLRDAESWNRLEESCPGINKGQLHPREEIDRLLRMRKEEPAILVSPAELEILEKEPV